MGWTLAWLAAVVCATWAFGALYFDFPTAGTLAAILFVVVLLATIVFVRGKLLKLAIALGAFALVVLWWLTSTSAPAPRTESGFLARHPRGFTMKRLAKRTAHLQASHQRGDLVSPSES